MKVRIFNTDDIQHTDKQKLVPAYDALIEGRLGTVDSEYINLAYCAKHHRQSRKKVIMEPGQNSLPKHHSERPGKSSDHEDKIRI
jgi:hypothetical protein